MRTGSDPLTEDLAELDARVDEAEREKRWEAFVDLLRTWTVPIAFSPWLYELYEAYLYRCQDRFRPGHLAWHIQQFAESEGWDGVLSAIARAMREQGKANS